MSDQTQQLTDLHRKLTRLHRELDLGRPAITMTANGKAASIMVRVGQQAIANALSASAHSMPKPFVIAAESHAIEVAQWAVHEIESMSIG